MYKSAFPAPFGRGKAGMLLDKAAEVGLVLEAQLVGDLCNGPVCRTEQYLGFEQKDIIDQVLWSAACGLFDRFGEVLGSDVQLRGVFLHLTPFDKVFFQKMFKIIGDPHGSCRGLLQHSGMGPIDFPDHQEQDVNVIPEDIVPLRGKVVVLRNDIPKSLLDPLALLLRDVDDMIRFKIEEGKFFSQ